jgi:hypothetical protein
MDVLEILASGMIESGQGGGGLGQGLLQLLELYGCRQSVRRLATLPVIVKSSLDVSLDGDDATLPRHLQDQVGIMWDHMNFKSAGGPKKVLSNVSKSGCQTIDSPCGNFPMSRRLREE